MKYLLLLVILFRLFFFLPQHAFSHSGNTAQIDGCHFCRTNCEGYGSNYLTRHGHGSQTCIESAGPTDPNYLKYLENRDKLLTVNTTNINDVIKILGQPHTKSIKDQNTWLYIERTRTRGKMTKLGRNILLNNNVLVVKFNNYGILQEKILYNKNDMNDYKFAESKTVNEIKRGIFIDSFLSSIREKMYAGKR